MEIFEKPAGTDDFLPGQMAQRNFVETAVRETFETYGYTQVQTPLFESFALLSAQAGEEIRHKMFTFVGSGVEYALRPELTAPVCRLIANGDMKPHPYPYKLYYIGQCVRQEPITESTDRRREFRQAGLELIGPAGPHADAEIIAVPVRVLETLGISGTQLRIGNTGVFREIFKQGALDPKDAAEMIWDINHLVTLRSECEGWDLETLRDTLNLLRRLQGSDYRGERRVDPDAIRELTETTAPAVAAELPEIAEATYNARWCRYFNVSEDIAACCIAISKIAGDPMSVMDVWETRFGGTAESARADLRQLCAALEDYGITDIEINLGITRGFDFYTGTVFQIELPETRVPLCGGGRYDNLIASFGGDAVPGAGFAFQFDALVAAFVAAQQERVSWRKDYFIAAGPAEARRLAETLRNAGKNVEVDLMGRDLSAQQVYAKQAGYTYLVRVDTDGSMHRVQLATGETAAVVLSDLC